MMNKMNANKVYNELLYNHLLDLLHFEFPNLKIRKRKDVWWCRLLDKTFLKKSKTQWACATWNSIIVPNDFDSWQCDHKHEIIFHERKHRRQYRKWSYPLFCVLYFLVLPIIFTMRAYFEKQAYYQSAVSMQMTRSFVDNEFMRQWFISWMARNFSRWEYFWMLPFKKHVRKWADRAWLQAKVQAKENTEIINTTMLLYK